MGKLLFVDKDDVIVNSAPILQSYVNRDTPFKTDDLRALDHIIANCEEIYRYTEKECLLAEKEKRFPEVPARVGLGNNDVIRKDINYDSINGIYNAPVRDKLLALNYAKWQKEMFLEERDHFLELDNLKDKEHGVVDYDSIYTIDNLNEGVIDFINQLVESNEFEAIYELSHHNGGREEIAKKRLNSIFPIPFLGLRFHLQNYQKGVRRPRSSKALYIKNLFNLDSLEDCYLIDDSKDNVKEWIRCGGKAIYYKPFTKYEKESGILEKGIPESARLFELDKDELLDAVFSLDNNQREKHNLIDKSKVYIKK